MIYYIIYLFGYLVTLFLNIRLRLEDRGTVTLNDFIYMMFLLFCLWPLALILYISMSSENIILWRKK